MLPAYAFLKSSQCTDVVHYADKHQGFVVAIDTERAGFDDEENMPNYGTER